MQIAGDKTREAASAIMGAVKEKMHDVADGATALVGKTTDKAKEMASSVGDAAVQAKDKAKEMASSVGDAAVYAKDQVKQAASATVEKAGDLGQDATDLIRRYPIAALVVGLGAGFLLGQVLHSSSRRA
jgi:ElaB/YqjD/DUF883 family membrane-anchored ribosome-binding protein